MLLTQFIPDFFVAEYYGLRNIIFWVTKDLASVLQYLDYILGLDANFFNKFCIRIRLYDISLS
jgi:hypothetical protein